MATSSSSSLLSNPLTAPLCHSNKSSLNTLKLGDISPITAAPRLKQNLYKVSYKPCNSVVCKAVSVKSQTEIEGLNIAEDVTQVSEILSCELGLFCLFKVWIIFFALLWFLVCVFDVDELVYSLGTWWWLHCVLVIGLVWKSWMTCLLKIWFWIRTVSEFYFKKWFWTVFWWNWLELWSRLVLILGKHVLE